MGLSQKVLRFVIPAKAGILTQIEIRFPIKLGMTGRRNAFETAPSELKEKEK
jgi:hypothetical protein